MILLKNVRMSDVIFSIIASGMLYFSFRDVVFRKIAQ